MKIQINRSILSSFLYFQAFPSACIYVFLHFFPYIFPYERFNKGKTILSTNKGYYSLLSVIPDFIKSLPRRAKYTLRTNLRFVLWVFRPCREQSHAGVTYTNATAFEIVPDTAIVFVQGCATSYGHTKCPLTYNPSTSFPK